MPFHTNTWSNRGRYAGNPPPISVLPVDILAHVFFECLPLPGLHRPKWPGSPPLVISHVCRFWRSVALNSGRLWADIDLSNLQLALHCLRHSKNAPLTIDWSRSWTTKKTVWLRPHAERIRRIQLDLETSDISAFVLLVGRNLPLLDDLIIQSCGVVGSGGSHPIYLGIHAPNLRRVSLGNVILTMVDLTSFLRETPHVEVVGFYVAGFSECLEAFPADPNGRIHLQDLRHLKFTHCSQILPLLNVLRLPKAMHLAIDSTAFIASTPITSETRSLFHDTFAHNVLKIEDLSITTWSDVEGADTGAFTFQAFSSFQFVAALTTLGSYLYDWTSIKKVLINKDGSFSQGRDWNPITALNGPTWAELFNQLTSLTTLSIRNMSLENVLSALCPSFTSGTADTSPYTASINRKTTVAYIPCPQLVTLYLLDLNLHHADSVRIPIGDEISDIHAGNGELGVGDVKRVLRLVTEREQAGVPLNVMYVDSHPGEGEKFDHMQFLSQS